MATMTMSNPASLPQQTVAQRIEAAGNGILRYGLVAVLVYFGAFKFTAVEAAAIQPLVANSPLMSWLYGVASTQAVSNLIGAVELAIAVLIALRTVSPQASAVGSLWASLTFLTTLSFLISTPGIWQQVPGFPLPVPNEAGAFLLKDVFLLGAGLTTAAEAWKASRR